MAYNLKYQSDFYNIFKTLVSVKLYKVDYGVHDLISIRTRSVTIELNYQDDKTPIIGTGAKVVIVNQGEFNVFDDLLKAYEKEYKCVIEYDGNVVFEGFQVCDLNEQQFIQNASIVLQFTNYVRKWEGSWLTSLSDISTFSSVLALIKEAVGVTGLENPILVNSTLFEQTMGDAALDSFLPQTFIENSLFYENLDDYLDTYTVLNKLLLPFEAFLYAYDQKWIVERIENVGKVGDWVSYAYADLSPSIVASLKQSLNKQDGDFKYIDITQNIQYNSGLQKLKINLKDSALTTLVFNNADVATMGTVGVGIGLYYITHNTWWINESTTGRSTGDIYGEIKHYIHWTGGTGVEWSYKGLYYAFNLQRNAFGKPTELSVNYKMNHGFSATMATVKVRFWLTVFSGAYLGYYVNGSGDHLTLTAAPYVFEVDIDTPSANELDVSKLLDLVPIFTDLGNPVIQDFMIAFLPSYYKQTISGTWFYTTKNYIGNFEIKITPDPIDNEITTVLNENFIKTDEIAIDVFDLDNINYNNGIRCGLFGADKASGWDSAGDSVYEPLVNIFIKDRFRKYSKTVRTLQATILADRYIKPFAILTDDNLVDDTSIGSIVEFLINKYLWNLVNGTYQIEAEEYSDTDIIISE